MARLRIPLPPDGLHRSSCKHLDESWSLRQSLLQHGAARDVLAFASHLHPGSYRCISGNDHLDISAIVAGHEQQLLPAYQDDLH